MQLPKCMKKFLVTSHLDSLTSTHFSHRDKQPHATRSVCLLDEATSALDVRTERALAEAMQELMKGRRGLKEGKEG